MTVDELDRTAALRPQPVLADGDAILARVLQQAPPRHRHLRLVGLAAAAAVVAVAVPALLPTSSPGGPAPAAAVELRRLAGVAADDAPLAAGQFRHLVVREEQAARNGQGALVTTLESWTDADGRTWRRDTVRHPDGSTTSETYLFPDSDGPSSTGLPTDPDALQQYLLAHAWGSTSTDEAVFTALADQLRGGTTPAPLRSAAAEVLARTGHVRLGPSTTDAFGRSVQEVDFVDEVGRPGEVQAIVFDTADARITAERITADGPLYDSVVEPADVTDAIPADVLASAVTYGAGSPIGQGG